MIKSGKIYGDANTLQNRKLRINTLIRYILAEYGLFVFGIIFITLLGVLS